MRTLVLAISTGLFVGYSPKAPGTAGTLLGLVLVLVTPVTFPVLLAFIIGGIIFAHLGETIIGRKDSQEIVIDEIVGFMVAMYLLPLEFLIPAFLLFRFFDIKKPGPIKKLQNFHGGLGIMLDDLVAGLFTNILLQIAYRTFF